VIDLHLHTTVSDGRSTPEQLARRVAAAGIRTCALTDHDTIGGLAAMSAAAEPLGVRVIAGIEITAVHDSLDVHMLGYFFNPDDGELATFLAAQREDRMRRVSEMLDKLAGMGIVLNRERLLKRAAKTAGKAIGRPAIAKLLVSNGHARDIADAFDRFIAAGRPAFVARRGVTPADVIQVVGRAGGIVSFAHAGKLGLDKLIAPLAAQGLAAIEVFHPDHDAAAVEKYRTMARDLGLASSGGSDYHGPGSGRAEALGQVTLPADAFEVLSARRLKTPGSES
jgi:predicted metal-dependent phosphoesterase TrpH